jgi:hypothetical protein
MISLLVAMAATNFWDGNQLYSDLCQPDKVTIACTTYVTGLIDGANLVSLRNGEELPFCIPPTATAGQLADVFKKELHDDPARRNLWGSSILWNAMTKAFPCPTPPLSFKPRPK